MRWAVCTTNACAGQHESPPGKPPQCSYHPLVILSVCRPSAQTKKARVHRELARRGMRAQGNAHGPGVHSRASSIRPALGQTTTARISEGANSMPVESEVGGWGDGVCRPLSRIDDEAGMTPRSRALPLSPRSLSPNNNALLAALSLASSPRSLGGWHAWAARRARGVCNQPRFCQVRSPRIVRLAGAPGRGEERGGRKRQTYPLFPLHE